MSDKRQTGSPPTAEFRSTLVYYWVLLILPSVPIAAALVRSALWAQRALHPRTDPLERFVAGYLPLIAVALLFTGLISLGVSRSAQRFEITAAGLRAHRRGATVTFGWDTLRLLQLRRGLYSSTVITDGAVSLRLEKFFIRDFDRLVKMIAHGIEVARRAAPRVDRALYSSGG
ncbi:MAG: hypothetical protein HY319_05940 [Armatimonadetes bacterium]|nr:hypothetical protein [Armatimonadota bacterium]